MKIVYTLIAAVALTGCATNRSLYDWGGYDSLLYQSYKKPENVAENMQKLEAHILKVEQGKGKVAPGLYADLGTLFLQAGNRQKALANFQKERDLWPESAGLMDAMIKNVQAAKRAQETKS
jgi:hypothetical protein